MAESPTTGEYFTYYSTTYKLKDMGRRPLLLLLFKWLYRDLRTVLLRSRHLLSIGSFDYLARGTVRCCGKFRGAKTPLIRIGSDMFFTRYQRRTIKRLVCNLTHKQIQVPWNKHAERASFELSPCWVDVQKV